MGTKPMTEAEATLIAGLALIERYVDQCERFPDTAEIPLSLYLEQNLYHATKNVLQRHQWESQT
jgi:hypothetical protein